MVRSKTYRRTRNGFALGLALLFLWWLDLGGPSKKEGKREKDQATTQSDAERGSDGDQQARPTDHEAADPEQTTIQVTKEATKHVGEQVGERITEPEPPSDLVEGRRESFMRLLLDEDFVKARLWLEAASGTKSELLRKLYEDCRIQLALVAEERETSLRARLTVLALEQAEKEVARFGRDFPERRSRLLVDLPAEVRSAPTAEELATWSHKVNDALPIEIEGLGRLLRFFKGKAVLRVPGEAGGFRHTRVEPGALPPTTLLALSPASEKEAARRFLCGLFAASGRPVAASWLYYGKIRLSERSPDPGR